MKRQGAPDHIIDAEIRAMQVAGHDGRIDLCADQVAAVRAFYACESQWRVTARFTSLVYIGLDYAACDVALRHAGIALDADGFADFQTLEAHACALLNGAKPSELRPS